MRKNGVTQVWAGTLNHLLGTVMALLRGFELVLNLKVEGLEGFELKFLKNQVLLREVNR